jgi:hypothetical protein
VRNKDDLLNGITDVVVAEIDLHRGRDHWKVALRRQVLAARTAMLRHRWAPRVLESRRVMSPILVRYMESIIRILREGGFSIDQTHHTLHVLGSRILGFNQDLFEDTDALDTSPEVAAIMAREMAHQYPYMTELAMSVSHDGGLGGCDDDLEFAFGLDLILDGLERLLDAEADGVTATAAPTVDVNRARGATEPNPAVTRAVADLRAAALQATDRDLERQLHATFVALLDSVLESPKRGSAGTRRSRGRRSTSVV